MNNKVKKFEPNWNSLDSRVISEWFQKAKVDVKACLLLTHNGEIPVTFSVQNDTIIIDPLSLSLKDNLVFAYSIKVVF